MSKNYRFNSKLIELTAPILNYLRTIGITNSFIEEKITNNPNTKYYLARNKFKNNPMMYTSLQNYNIISEASGIQIVRRPTHEQWKGTKFSFKLPRDYFILIKEPQPNKYPYYFDFLDSNEG